MRLILFDLDGTLLTAGGIGRRSTRRALESVFGTSGNLADFYFGGRTQEAIFLDTLLDLGFGEEDFRTNRDQLYQVFLSEFMNGITSGEHKIKPLPGGISLIKKLYGAPNVTLGIVTGNHRENAEIKLELAGFKPDWFSLGAYGEESADRSALVPLAQNRASQLTGHKIPGNQTIVVGDTTRDIGSAKSVGAVSVALTTGTDDRKLLESASPDYILNGLRDQEVFFEILNTIGENIGGNYGI